MLVAGSATGLGPTSPGPSSSWRGQAALPGRKLEGTPLPRLTGYDDVWQCCSAGVGTGGSGGWEVCTECMTVWACARVCLARPAAVW